LASPANAIRPVDDDPKARFVTVRLKGDRSGTWSANIVKVYGIITAIHLGEKVSHLRGSILDGPLLGPVQYGVTRIATDPSITLLSRATGSTVRLVRYGLTVLGGRADFRPIAEYAIVAQGVIGCVDDDVVDIIATVVSAADAVVDHRSDTRLAIVDGVADLGAIAKQAIVAKGVISNMNDRIELLVTKIFGTRDAIIKYWSGARQAHTRYLINGLLAVTK